MIHQNKSTQQTDVIRSWKKSLQQGFSNWLELAQFLQLNPDEYSVVSIKHFPMRVPLSFAQKMEKGNINDPLLRQVLPISEELQTADGYVLDPLNEMAFNPIKGLLHKYHNRALLMLHPACAIHCRYCFRREFDYKAQTQAKESWQYVFEYLKTHSELDEVIFSGGDPLMHNDETLDWFIQHLEEISHIKRLRIHTRIPVVLPDRITEGLVKVFNKTRLQKIMVIHANHPNEIAQDVTIGLKKLQQIGFTLLNQSTLLKGVNDHPETLKALSEALFEAGVIPYYLHLLDKVKGAIHFDIEENKAKEIHAQLKSITSGFLVPKLVREIAHQRSKTWIGSEKF
ncbi:EF-P beta-lysylation protein EpmB [Fastidiosibacter lacustris]|uniref:EF-P beta-lysylation protein EpmB n=1 Tax=Fastidiosibacter lacustris TaxID=2056695 RepID=UPI001EFE37C5|nr:EF-P beta-lysylation protein EpmB [Fastidiosibacter lacustris]